MTSYGQYCPIARATEIVADRWTPLLVRELLCGVRRFSDLQRGLPGISRSLLVRRLDALARAGVIERHLDESQRPEYVLTDRGRKLDGVVDALGAWGAEWLADGEPRADELDPKLLLWFMHRRIDIEALPAGRTVVRFDFDGVELPMWLILERPMPSVCLVPPGFDEDLVIAGDLRAFYRVWFGHDDLAAAIRGGSIVIDGRPDLARGLSRWLQLSRFAQVIAAAERRRATGSSADDRVGMQGLLRAEPVSVVTGRRV